MIQHFVSLILLDSAGRSLNLDLGLDLKKGKRRFGVMLGIEGDIESGLSRARRTSSHSSGLSSIKRMEGCVTICY
jgi:hypothetical protein